MQCARYIPQILRSAHLSNAGVVEACYFLTLPFIQVAGAVIWPAVFVAVAGRMKTSIETGHGGLLSFWWFFGLVFLLGIAPFAMWGPIYRRKCEPAAPRWKGLVWGVGMWIYVYYMYVSVIRAGTRLLLGRTGWVKTQRNAEPIGSRTRKAMADDRSP
jgi:1,2-diacylglycerol 3-beta-glucosyltransferase